MNITITPESEWLSSNRMSSSDVDNDSLSDMDAAPPVHPVPQMQGAFEESMMETLNESEDSDNLDRMSKSDSVSRRKMLLEGQEYQRTVAGRWKQKPGEQFHPLWKLVAQISFGMHLLQQGLAKSDEEVIKILQTHVDEVDGFLERTTEDFDLAQGDIDERIRYLKLPLEHGSVFDTMLNDRNFRIAIVEGNEKIEHIIDRTAAAMNDALKDVQKGLDATRELAKYLTRVDKQWDDRTEEHDSVYLAMIGNTEGWTRAFLTLQSKGNALRRALVQLGGIVAEMQRRAGAASRKNLIPVRSVHGRYMVEPHTKSPSHSMTPPKSPMKPLPTAPSTAAHSPSQQHSQQSTPRSSSQQTNMKHRSKNSIEKTLKSSKDIRHFESSSPPRLERAMSAKRVEPILRDTTPEYTKPRKSPDPPMPVKSPQTIVTQLSPKSNKSEASPSGVAMSSPDRVELATGSEEAIRARSPELMIATKSTDPIIAVRQAEAKPPIPIRSPSRKPSITNFTERARFHLGRRKSLSKEREQEDASSTSLPIQSPSADDSPIEQPPSPQIRRLSTRRANAASMSTYSSSPTSTVRQSESPVLRETSPPLLFDSGARKPSHTSYSSISFLPLHPQLSPLPDYSIPFEHESTFEPLGRLQRSTSVNSGTTSKRASMINPQTPVRRSSSVTSNSQLKRSSSIDLSSALERSSSVKASPPKRSSSLRMTQPSPIPDDAGGSVNLQHPLLREARHTKFAGPANTERSARGSSRDLPLRHYHSQDNFHSIGFASRQRDLIPPKRTSSLLYNPPEPTSPSAHPALASPLEDEDKLSPAPAQSSATPAPLNITSKSNAETNGSIAPNSSKIALLTASSPDELGDSEDATPPPIGRGAKSPTPTAIKVNTNLGPSTRSPAIKSPVSANSQPTYTASPAASQTASSTHKYKTSATNNIPFYLNPVSSAALTDFLASTPPPSPPHPPRSNTDPNAFDTQNLYRNYRTDNGSSPVPPGPGGMPMLPLSLAQAGPRNASTVSPATENKKAGWKKMFGAKIGGKTSGTTLLSREETTKALKQKQKKAKKEKREDGAGKTEKSEKANGHAKGTHRGFGLGNENFMNLSKESFFGMGKDGVWLSRKNFAKT